jgi:hypothetical protein
VRRRKTLGLRRARRAEFLTPGEALAPRLIELSEGTQVKQCVLEPLLSRAQPEKMACDDITRDHNFFTGAASGNNLASLVFVPHGNALPGHIVQRQNRLSS